MSSTMVCVLVRSVAEYILTYLNTLTFFFWTLYMEEHPWSFLWDRLVIFIGWRWLLLEQYFVKQDIIIVFIFSFLTPCIWAHEVDLVRFCLSFIPIVGQTYTVFFWFDIVLSLYRDGYHMHADWLNQRVLLSLCRIWRLKRISWKTLSGVKKSFKFSILTGRVHNSWINLVFDVRRAPFAAGKGMSFTSQFLCQTFVCFLYVFWTVGDDAIL